MSVKIAPQIDPITIQGLISVVISTCRLIFINATVANVLCEIFAVKWFKLIL
jgi:hypothetical protein